MKCTTISFKTLSIVLILIPFILVGQKRDFPYALKSSDFIVIGVGLSSELIAKYRQSNQPLMTNDELIKLDRSDINKFDRSATYNWSNNLSKASNLTRTILVASPSILLLNEGIKKEWKNSLTYGVMYFEVVLVTSGLTDLTKSIALRKRPYLYNTNISLAEREKMIAENNVFNSFFSGHTSLAFATAVFLSKTYTAIYGKTVVSKIIWATSLALASTTGYLRYKSGHHYPTDVIAGAFVGSAIGYFIPVLHTKNSKTKNLSYSITGTSFRLTYILK